MFPSSAAARRLLQRGRVGRPAHQKVIRNVAPPRPQQFQRQRPPQPVPPRQEPSHRVMPPDSAPVEQPSLDLEGGPPELDGQAETELWRSIKAHNTKKVLALLANVAPGSRLVTEADARSGWTLLTWVLYCRSPVSVVQRVLELGADPNEQANRSWPVAEGSLSPLRLAAKISGSEMVNLLLGCGAEVDLRSSKGWTALTTAAACWNGAAAAALLDAGATRDGRSDPDGFTPLMRALEPEWLADRRKIHKVPETGAIDSDVQLSVVELLLMAGADPNASGSFGTTPLHLAAAADHEQILRILMGARAEVDARDAQKRTPLMEACARHNYGAVHVLVDEGKADVNAVNAGGFTPLRLVAACRASASAPAEDVVALVQFLMERGASFAPVADADGGSPLTDACQSPHHELAVDVVEALLSAGAPANSALPDGRSALALAVEAGNQRLMDLLLDARARVDGPRGTIPPLVVAVRRRNKELASRLLQSGADPNLGDAEGKTALMAAAETLDADMINLLMEFDADVTQTDKTGSTALHWLVKAGRPADMVRTVAGAAEALLSASGAARGRKREAALNSTDRAGYTPVMLAAKRGDTEAVLGLLSCHASPVGALVPAVRSLAGTPLVLALLRAGASPKEVVHGQTPLMAACSLGLHEEIEALLGAGCSATAPFADGRTPLETAARTGSLASVQVLLKRGAEPSAKALRAACEGLGAGAGKVVVALSRAGVGAPDNDLLHVAVGSGSFAAANAILSIWPALVKSTIADGSTALHVAAAAGHKDMVRLLTHAGADLGALDSRGRTPLEVGKELQRVAAVAELVRSGALHDAKMSAQGEDSRSRA